MIEIVYYKNHNRLTITGHAQSGEPGKDLVCAGVTTLVYTLASNVQELEAAGYAFFARLEENLPPNMPPLRRTSEFNWNGSLL